MSNELKNNLNAIELTENDLDNIMGGNSDQERIQMIIKMNEALAKMLKSVGESIKGLA
jgi:bacteriocin-like protein